MATELAAYWGGRIEVVMSMDMHTFTEMFKSMCRIKRRNEIAKAPIMQVAAQGTAENMKQVLKEADREDGEGKERNDGAALISRFGTKV